MKEQQNDANETEAKEPAAGTGRHPPVDDEGGFEQFIFSRRGWWLWVVCGLVAVGGVVAAYLVVEPAPPQVVTIAAGPAEGNYFRVAQAYAEVFERNGIELRVLETEGSVANYRLLLEGTADLGLVQAGTLPEAALTDGTRDELASIAAVYLEPLFVFYPAELGELEGLEQFDGVPLVAGTAGSGTRRLVEDLSALIGIEPELVDAPAGGMRSRKVAVAKVISPDAPAVARMLADDSVRLLPFPRAEAISRRLPYLSPVTLPRGVVDMPGDLPPADVQLVAPAAVLLTRQETHGAAVLLAAMAAGEVHRAGTYLSAPGDFPNDRLVELPVSDTAAHYFRSGPNIIRRTLPFWAASFFERMLIIAVPLLTLLIPLARVTPPVYRWRIRRRIVWWYRDLRRIDAAAERPGVPKEEILRKLDQLQRDTSEVNVPLSYMDELYELRSNIYLLRRQVERGVTTAGTEQADTTPAVTR